ncbi:MAG: DMT family transporter [Thermodesulfobacteriota bacterium]
MPNLHTNHRKGIQLAAFGVLVLSFDALLIRLADTTPWNVMFWRGGLMMISLSLLVMIRTGLRSLHVIMASWRIVLLLSVIYGINGSLFVTALSLTSTANTVVILSCSAFFAAFFSWLLLRERLLARTWLAISICVLGVVVVFFGSIGYASLAGDLVALLLAVSMGMVFTLWRLYSHLPRMPVIGLSGLVMCLIAIPMSTPFSLPQASYPWLIIMGLIQIPAASVLLMSATRYLSSPEVSLFLLIETVFGPIWVWLVLGEEVAPLTLWGGAIILTTIIIHSWISIRTEQCQLSPGDSLHPD